MAIIENNCNVIFTTQNGNLLREYLDITLDFIILWQIWTSMDSWLVSKRYFCRKYCHSQQNEFCMDKIIE